MTDSSSKDDSRKQILGPQGMPIPPRITWRDRWDSFSRKTRLAIVSLGAFVAATAALVATLQTIEDYFRPAPSPPGVPPIVLEITNSSEEPIAVAARGDFFLWLPGPDARHTIGKFELHSLDGDTPDSGTFTVAPSAKVRVLAHVMNQDLYGRILEQADCDIAFMVRKGGGGHRTTDNLPFTKDAIDKYFTTVDIGAE